MRKGYKYRCIEQPFLDRDLAAIAANQFYASTFTPQNDLFEANYQDDISPSLQLLGPLFNADTSEVSRSLQKVFDYTHRVGIFCLSNTAVIETMWAYYASNHHGYCIEYALHKLQDTTSGNDYSQLLEVTYTDDLRKLDLGDMKQQTFTQKMFGTKKKLWAHEDEVRLIFDSEGFKSHHPSAITGIYFGYRASDQLIEQFKNAFANRDIIFYKIRLNRQTNELETDQFFSLRRTLTHPMDGFSYKVLAHRDNKLVENYDVYLEGSHDEESLRKFIAAFREKYCYKLSNINIFNRKDILPLLTGRVLEGRDYLRYADAFMGGSDFASDYLHPSNTYKDDKYKEIARQVGK